MIAARFIGWIDPVKVVIPNVKSVVVLRRIYPVFHPQKGYSDQLHYRHPYCCTLATTFAVSFLAMPMT